MHVFVAKLYLPIPSTLDPLRIPYSKAAQLGRAVERLCSTTVYDAEADDDAIAKYGTLDNRRELMLVCSIAPSFSLTASIQ